MSSPPDTRSHTIDITLEPPLSNAHEANLWVEETGEDGKTDEGVDGDGRGGGDVRGSSPSRRPTLVLSRVDGAGVEQRFLLPFGTSHQPPPFSFPGVFSITLHSLTLRRVDCVFSFSEPIECRRNDGRNYEMMGETNK